MAVALSIFTGGISISLAVAEQPDRQVAVDTLSEVTNPPIYPPAAASMHIGGTVTLLVKVGVNGVAEDVTVSESSGVRALDVAAIQAAYKWKYFPEVKSNRLISSYARIPVSFPGTPVQRVVDHSVRKKFATRNDPVFGDYARMAEARILAKGNELYPGEARKNHWYGKVQTTTCIRHDGSVASVDIIQSSGIAGLDQSMVASIRAAAPFDKMMVEANGPDQLCITATFEFAHGNGH